MSVIVKGLEMPKICGQCQIKLGIDCELWKHVRSVSLDRHKDCPLTPVPLHGDLIERKTAYDSILNGMVMTGYQSKALDCIDEIYVPTIIPAEEE